MEPMELHAALRAGVDSVEHASFIDEEGINLAKRNGTYLSMDVYVSDFILAEGAAAGMLEGVRWKRNARLGRYSERVSGAHMKAV